MGSYNQPIEVPFDVTVNEKYSTVTISSKKFSYTFIEGRLIRFKGITDCFMIHKVYPNGATLISARTSIPMFMSWREMFKPGSIFFDCLMITGWMEIK